LFVPCRLFYCLLAEVIGQALCGLCAFSSRNLSLYNNVEYHERLMKEKDLHQLQKIERRIDYLQLVKDDPDWGNLQGYKEACQRLQEYTENHTAGQHELEIRRLSASLHFLEERADEQLSPVERLRIARSPERFCLGDILENVYQSFIELGGRAENNIDPAMICARATLRRTIKNSPYLAPVMVIGQETGHGVEDFRRRGYCLPEGNAKALKYMKIAETEGIPIHFYIFTPGCWPVEENGGAAQQIARNISAMTRLRVPLISMICQGGGEGAEAIGLTDCRLMASHGYYSVVSPEEAAAIEGKIPPGIKVPDELIELCASRLKITAEDNLRLGTIDRIIKEPLLGGKRDDCQFFSKICEEMTRATDRVVRSCKSFAGRKHFEMVWKNSKTEKSSDLQPIPWNLSPEEIKRLLALRSQKYRSIGEAGRSGQLHREPSRQKDTGLIAAKGPRTPLSTATEDLLGDGFLILDHLKKPIAALVELMGRKKPLRPQKMLTYTGDSYQQGNGRQRVDPLELTDIYTRVLNDTRQTVSCPNAEQYGCAELWVRDLYAESSGVCENCGHHFALGQRWYLEKLFDPGSIHHLNSTISAGNPLNYTGFTKRLQVSKTRTGWPSGNMTFRAAISGIESIVCLLYAEFNNGTVGTAEGEKFIRACDLARQEKKPLLACIQTTGGMRFQEGTLGLIQMAKCTVAAREYIEAGGLYLVVHDNNSFGGPVASFLGCAPYQFAITGSRIGFSGPGKVAEMIAAKIPPDYHSAENGLKRGHIQGVWDRRELRRNLHRALLTLSGPRVSSP
jgi:acetyl-CoA carboxylase carboxyl transferase subunit beta